MSSSQAKLIHPLSMPLMGEAIEACIPHRPPFRLIDEVISVIPDEKVVAVLVCDGANPILQGHFPSRPILPGVLMVEAAAQAACVLAYMTFPNGYSEVFLTEVSSSRFRRMIAPGDRLVLDVNLIKKRSPFFWFEGTGKVADELAVTFSFSACIR